VVIKGSLKEVGDDVDGEPAAGGSSATATAACSGGRAVNQELAAVSCVRCLAQ